VHMGIKHRKVTPEHPEANGGAERFMQSLAKVVRVALEEKRDWRTVLNEFLRNYRAAPHSVTGVDPNTLMFGRNRTSRLLGLEPEPTDSSTVATARANDERAKLKSKGFTDRRRRAKNRALSVGDRVFAKTKRTNKWQTRYSSEDLVVTATKRSMVSVRAANGQEFSRNRQHFVKQPIRLQAGSRANTAVEATTTKTRQVRT
jgi:hypothetical protein